MLRVVLWCITVFFGVFLFLGGFLLGKWQLLRRKTCCVLHVQLWCLYGGLFSCHDGPLRDGRWGAHMEGVDTIIGVKWEDGFDLTLKKYRYIYMFMHI